MLRRALSTWRDAWPYALLPPLVASLHLLEVNLVDARATAAVRAALGGAFAPFASLEAPLTEALGALDTRLVALTAAYYLVVFLLFLGWVPALVAADGDPRLLRRTLLCYPLVYLLALPWVLLFPSDNPYTRVGATSPFDGLHPRLEDLYYLLTTRDNTFPSLHVAFTAVLVAAVLRTRWTLLKPVFLVHGGLLVSSVVALRVHHAMDVVGGLLLAWAALRLADACLAPRGALSGLGRTLDRIARARPGPAAAETGKEGPEPDLGLGGT